MAALASAMNIDRRSVLSGLAVVAVAPDRRPRPVATAVQADIHLSGTRFHQVSPLNGGPLMGEEP